MMAAMNPRNENNMSLYLPSPDYFLSLLSGSSRASKELKSDMTYDINMDQFSTVYLKSASGFQSLFGDAFPFNLSFPALMVLLGLFIVVSTYLILVRMLRFRRIEQLQSHYNYRTRASLAQMTDQEAWEIQRAMSQLEFPFTFEKSLQFALFRTYGIPTISSTLIKTKQFSDARYSGKRYVDTCVMIAEFIVHSPASMRARLGLSRTKYLHHSYRKSGLVREDDMLYTLSLFATEPVRFVNLYEWRPVTDLERCALGTFWKSVGDALGIDYADFLPTTEFKDGIHWLEEVTAWAQEYEKRTMIPAQTNKDTADQTTAILTYALPGPLKFIGNWFVLSMMDERLRLAMMYPPPPTMAKNMFSFLFDARKLFLRYLSLPRPESMRYRSFTETPDEKSGAYHVTIWQAEPYYVKPTLWNRWLSPAAMVARVMGYPLPGDDGDKYYPNGYDLGDMGPKRFEGKGKEYLDAEMKILERERRGQCPFLQQ